MGFILWSKLCIYLHLSQKMRDINSHSMISYEHDVLQVLRVLSIVHYTYFHNSSLWNVFFKSSTGMNKDERQCCMVINLCH